MARRDPRQTGDKPNVGSNRRTTGIPMHRHLNDAREPSPIAICLQIAVKDHGNASHKELAHGGDLDTVGFHFDQPLFSHGFELRNFGGKVLAKID